MHFGVEVECFLPRTPPFLNDAGARAPIVADMKKHMARLPPAARAPPEDAYQVPTAVMYFTYEAAKGDALFEAWKVTTDQSIRGDHGESVGGLEFITPKLPFQPYAIEATRHFVTGIAVGGFVCNDTTALHVHVSCEDLTNVQVRRFFAYFIAFEHIFDLFVTPRRRDDCNRYIRSNLLSLSPNRDWREAATRVETTEVSNGLEHLIDMMCVKLAPAHNSERNHKLNCILLRGKPEGDPRRRVEFRGHQGTTDPHAVCDWASLCVRFVRAAGRMAQSPVQLAREHGYTRLPEAEFWTLVNDSVLEKRFEWYKQAAEAASHEFAYEGREMFLTSEDAYADQLPTTSATE